MAVFDAVRFHSRVNASRLAVVSAGSFAETLTYFELGDLVDRLERYLLRNGATPRGVVAVDVQDRLLHLAAVLALSRLGATAVSLSSGGLDGQPKADLAVQDGDRIQGVPSIGIDVSRLLEDSADERRPAPADVLHATAIHFADAGEEQTVALSAGLLAGRFLRNSALQGGCISWACIGDIRSEEGFATVLGILSAGGTALLSAGTFENDFQMMRLYQVNAIIVPSRVAAPYFAIITRQPTFPGGIRQLIVSGEDFDEQTLTLLRRHVSNDLTLALTVRHFGPVATLPRWEPQAGWTYQPLPFTEIRAEGEAGNPVSPEETGRLAVRSAIPAGGHGDQADPADAGATGEWHRSTIRGFVGGDGTLTVTP